MVSADGLEIERKYDVDDNALLPALHDLPGVERVEQPVEHRLNAVYFDTDDLILASQRITLRRRTGGSDAGWHLKLPEGPDSRRELHEAAGKNTETVPEALLRRVRVHLRGRDVRPVFQLRTRRITHTIHGTGDTVLGELVDDQVKAEPLLDGAEARQWREWEIELVNADPGWLDTVEPVLLETGARPADHASKLQRALAGLYPDQRPRSTSLPRRHASAGQVFIGYLADQVDLLKAQDPRVRCEEPDGIHRMRVATRRMRSALATHRKLLAPETDARLRGELKWLTGVLGEARDAEVLRDRLADLVDHEPGDLVLGPVAQRIDKKLSTRFHDGHAKVLQALDDPRYFTLLNDLDTFLGAPGLTDKAGKPASKTMTKVVAKDAKRLQRSVRAVAVTGGEREHDAALHEARKKAKRLRYAAEAARAVYGKKADKVASSAHRLQKILGDHQDSVVSRALLRELGAESYLDGENGFTFGRLHALEQQTATATEARFNKAWKKLSPLALH